MNRYTVLETIETRPEDEAVLITYDTERRRLTVIVEYQGRTYTDWPIRYRETGTVAWDHPERIHPETKKLAAVILNQIYDSANI